MALRARHEVYVQPTTTPVVAKKSVRPPKKERTSLFERFIYIATIMLIVAFAIVILNKQSSLQTISIEIQKIEEETQKINNQNTDLSVLVKELSRYDRIWEKAQALGLTQNTKNVKVVPEQ